MQKNKRLIGLFLVLLTFLLIGSRCGDTKIEQGTLRDTIFSVEHHYNGATSVWFTHDDIVGYCTGNSELASKADELLQHHGEVIASYRDINQLTDSEAAFWQASECGNIGGAESGTEVMLLIGLEPVPHRATGR